MKPGYFVLYNSNGNVSRVASAETGIQKLIYRKDNRRIEFTLDSEALSDQDIEFVELGDVAPAKKSGAVVLDGPWGTVKYQNEITAVQNDIEAPQETDRRDIMFFLKWSGVTVAGLLMVSMIIGFFLKPDEKIEPQVVTVFQKRAPEKIQSVQVSEKKITQQQTQKAVVSNKNKPKQVSDQKTKKTAPNATYSRSGTELQRVGALSAFGGFSKTSKGLGGLNNSASKSSGYGFDSSRAAGGHSRGMLGKGLVQAGIGSGGAIQGYGGYGTNGKGSGQAAFGDVGMAGRSSGYYLPLSEEAKITGGLDRDQINAVVQRNLGQVIYCYEQGLQSKPNLSGRVTVNFQISPNGLVSIAGVTQTNLGSRQVESCIVGKLRNWQFPKPKGNVSVRVTYPFVLKRLGQG